MLLTRAPVAAGGVATTALPLDLHVLSLSLAFILSQDQTLRCCIYLFSFSQFKKTNTPKKFCLAFTAGACRPRGAGLGSLPLDLSTCRIQNLTKSFII